MLPFEHAEVDEVVVEGAAVAVGVGHRQVDPQVRAVVGREVLEPQEPLLAAVVEHERVALAAVATAGDEVALGERDDLRCGGLGDHRRVGGDRGIDGIRGVRCRRRQRRGRSRRRHLGERSRSARPTPGVEHRAVLVDLVVDEQGVHAEHAEGEKPDADEDDRRHGQHDLEVASNPTHDRQPTDAHASPAPDPRSFPTVPDSERTAA